MVIQSPGSGPMTSLPRSSSCFWPLLALATAVILFLFSLCLIREAPLPAGWDEALYFGRAYHDLQIFQAQGLKGLIGALRYGEMVRPPGYRLPVLPFNMIFGLHAAALKLHALIFWGMTLALVYGAGRKLAGRAAGGFAVVYLALTPNLIASSYLFSTEYLLYFSIALLFYALAKVMTAGKATALDGGLVILAAALGGLAKLSFYFLLGPLVPALLYAGWRDARFYPRPLWVLGTLGAGNLLILPWWITAWRDVLNFTLHVTGTFERHSLGSGISVSKFIAWLRLLEISALGPAVAAVTLLSPVVFIAGRRCFESSQKRILAIFIFCALPTLWLSFSGTNSNPRYVAPVFFPIALALGMGASATGWLSSFKKRWFLAALFMGQLALTVWPTSGDARYQKRHDSQNRLVGEAYDVMYRRPDQWDWGPFRELVAARGYREPRIGHLGQGKAFHPPGIALPWTQHREKADVRLLWRYEMGSISWEKTLEEAMKCDVLVTAPGFSGRKDSKEPLDNQHNAEFVQRVEASGVFEGPVTLRIGKWDPAELVIFFNKNRH